MKCYTIDVNGIREGILIDGDREGRAAVFLRAGGTEVAVHLNDQRPPEVSSGLIYQAGLKMRQNGVGAFLDLTQAPVELPADRFIVKIAADFFLPSGGEVRPYYNINLDERHRTFAAVKFGWREIQSLRCLRLREGESATIRLAPDRRLVVVNQAGRLVESRIGDSANAAE